ncbi:MAG: hypothetical protein GVX78_00140 [Bacteroidetes bacterium]|jgi:hypothetical protein|nr:hypothetical protein [Bacteroidota bacterium]
MRSYSSYKELVRKRKEIQLQKEFLWNEISQLHRSKKHPGNSFWVQKLLSIDPTVVIQGWKLAVKVGRVFKRSKDEDN